MATAEMLDRLRKVNALYGFPQRSSDPEMGGPLMPGAAVDLSRMPASAPVMLGPEPAPPGWVGITQYPNPIGPEPKPPGWDEAQAAKPTPAVPSVDASVAPVEPQKSISESASERMQRRSGGGKPDLDTMFRVLKGIEETPQEKQERQNEVLYRTIGTALAPTLLGALIGGTRGLGIGATVAGKSIEEQMRLDRQMEAQKSESVRALRNALLLKQVDIENMPERNRLELIKSIELGLAMGAVKSDQAQKALEALTGKHAMKLEEIEARGNKRLEEIKAQGQQKLEQIGAQGAEARKTKAIAPVKSPGVTPLGKVSPKQEETLSTMKSSLDNMAKIEEAMSDPNFDSGVLAPLKEGIKRVFNIQGQKRAYDLSTLKTVVSKQRHELYGAGLTGSERKDAQEQFPNISDSPDTFRGKARVATDNELQRAESLLSTLEASGKDVGALRKQVEEKKRRIEAIRSRRYMPNGEVWEKNPVTGKMRLIGNVSGMTLEAGK